jgi:hypothetical protein
MRSAINVPATGKIASILSLLTNGVSIGRIGHLLNEEEILPRTDTDHGFVPEIPRRQ